MKKNFSPIFIFLGVAALVVIPIIASGYLELRAAEQTDSLSLAAQHYERAAIRLPWRADLWEKAASAAFHANELDEAIRLFLRASSLSAEGWDLYGSAYWLKSDHKTALQLWMMGVDAHSDYAPLYDRLVMAYDERGEYQLEQDALVKRLSLEDDAQSHYRLGLLLTLSHLDSASRELLSASSLDPQFDPAVRSLRAALDSASREPDPARRFVVMGRALGIVNEWNLAARAFDDAIHVDANNAEAWAWLGEAKQQTGADGSVELDRALTLDDKSAVVRALRGLHWKRQEKYQQALAEYLLAAEYEPNNPAWQSSLGDAYVDAGNLTLALESYQHAAELAPNDATYFRLLAAFCAANEVNVEDIGLPAAQKAVELAPNDPLALDTLGWTYLVTGRLTLAQQSLARALELSPNFHGARLHLAMTYLTQNDFDSAYKELTRVREADPQGDAGKLAQRLLEQYFP